jgi:hypothetical protein
LMIKSALRDCLISDDHIDALSLLYTLLDPCSTFLLFDNLRKFAILIVENIGLYDFGVKTTFIVFVKLEKSAEKVSRFSTEAEPRTAADEIAVPQTTRDTVVIFQLGV